MSLQVCAVFRNPGAEGDGTRELLRQTLSFHEAVARNPEVFAVRDRRDLEEVAADRVGLMLGIEGVSAVVTPRNLLCHTSGFDADHFTDTGRGDDALALYVAGCADLPQIASPGLIWSYSNSGYSILGRIVEVLHGSTFEDVLRERIFEPLALEHTVSFADEAIVHPVSVGHDPDPADPQKLGVSSPWGLARAFGPMGAAVIASAGDVLRFVQPHLDGGVHDGAQLLDGSLVPAMQEEQVLSSTTSWAMRGASVGSSTAGAMST